MPKTKTTKTRPTLSKRAVARKVSFRTDKTMALVLARLDDPDAFIRAAVLARLIPSSKEAAPARRKKA